MTQVSSARGFSVRDVAELLDLSDAQVRSYVRAGFLHPRTGKGGEFRFSFEDLVLLRTTKELTAAQISPRRVHAALGKLREQLPRGRSVTTVRIIAEGSQIVVRDGSQAWNPESGQVLFDFEVAELAQKAAPLAHRAAAEARENGAAWTAQDWYELGCDLEVTAPEEAVGVYRRALELDPEHVDTHLNLGCLLHEEGEVAEAERHYHAALEASPGDATAAFNLGVALEDLGRAEEALKAYEQAIASEPEYADAYYNAATLCEKSGDKAAALRLLKKYRALTRLKDSPGGN